MPTKKAALDKSLTKAQMVSEVATKADLTKVQTAAVFAAISEVIAAELKAGRAVTIPGLVKITLQHKAAVPARTGPNPFSAEKEIIAFKAKPARKVVEVRAVKALKEMA